MPTNYTSQYVKEAAEILQALDQASVEEMVRLLVQVRRGGGRLFFVGVGGGAGHASHAVCDFRKIAGMEAYSVTDNVSELTARINDDGWDSAYEHWLRGSRLRGGDMLFVFSVGGGDLERRISSNVVHAVRYAKQVGALVCAIVGRDGGYAAKAADVAIVVRTVNPDTVTPHTESFQAMLWHLLVSHPELKCNPMKWESVR
ncbi:MAG: SIS domain-containing protein [Acidobacteriia bacterium]|nr:SIS domain-containing protein [Terriglobia bacterium]